MFADFTRTKTKAGSSSLGHNLLIAPVATIADGAPVHSLPPAVFSSIAHPGWETFHTPVRLPVSVTPIAIGAALRIGEHTDEVNEVHGSPVPGPGREARPETGN
jgi:hypothetical protein